MAQIHKKFADSEVKDLLQRYVEGNVRAEHIQGILGIKRRRFFKLLNKYKNDPTGFSIQYHRKPFKTVTMETETNIIKELKIEQRLIEDKNIPIRYYNYSYVKDLLLNKYKQKVSLPTIIDRARNGI